VLLEVTPRISAENNIALTVQPEVSDIAGVDSQTLDGATYTANIFSIRRIKTQVLIPSGNTLVLGGLLSDDARKRKTKVPLLGDLPGMKNIFGSTSKSRRKGNLLIFVTPTVVEDEDYQPAATQFLKQRMPADGSPTDLGTFDGPWDGVEPYDWGKPIY
jgi:general secretion pathway protein D